MDVIIQGLLPFSVLENNLFKKYLRYAPVEYHIFLKCMNLLTAIVETKISRKLPTKFVLIVDGWSTSDTHYFANFATYPANDDVKYEFILLEFSPFETETALNAKNMLTTLNLFSGFSVSHSRIWSQLLLITSL